MPNLSHLEEIAGRVRAHLQPTAQIAWPLLARRVGAEIWVKHENHNPTGAFKIRGGLNYLSGLRAREPKAAGVVAATRGNHGQSIAYAAAAHGYEAVIVIPHGNSVEKNRAMRAYGATLVEHGHDFQAAFEHAHALAAERRLHFVPSYDERLIEGVASYGLELFRAVPDLDVVYVPIGLGSGIAGVIGARDALGLSTPVVGVVAANAPAYALSFARGEPVATNSADTFADGVACRVPVEAAVDLICRRAERVVQVEEAEIEAAMRWYYADTHNLAEGAGAAALAAAYKERDRIAGQRVAVVLSGGNIDRDVYRAILDADDD